MQIIYEGVDITNATKVHKADIGDNAGGIADNLELWFSDPQGIWSKWKPEKNHKVIVNHEGFSSGLMFVDELEQQRGYFLIRALSIPQESKTLNTKAWENIRFLEFSREIATKYGFSIETYGIENYFYERVDQLGQTDFEFLAYRCFLEGYMLKITDRKVVIYSERYMESLEPARTIYLEQLDGNYKFKDISSGIYSGCRIKYGNTSSEFQAPDGLSGPLLKRTDVFVASQGEAERYSRGILRFHNKKVRSGSFLMKLDSSITAGNNIYLQGVGLADGKYFCEQVIHRLVDGKMIFRVRRPLEGY